MESISPQVQKGQAVYTNRILNMYDLAVVRISSQYLWKCPKEEILKLYNQHITGNHLDIGVGTGYFLNHCQFPVKKPRLALMDLNKNCLETTKALLAHYKPTAHRQNLMTPFSLKLKPFDSIGLNYVLHCLPGTMEDKRVALQNIKNLMNPNATLFGSTILSKGVGKNLGAKALMRFYNQKGIFSNTSDSPSSLEHALKSVFSDVEVKIKGCVGVFVAKN